MAVQAFPYLALTDGTTTVTFADGLGGLTNYPPVRDQWAPTISGLDLSLLGGRGPYTDVIETITITIRDTTAALCWSRLDTLTRLLDQADRWWMRNEQVAPVVMQYVPQGSTINSTANPLQAIVRGRAPDDETSAVQLPITTNDAGMIFEIHNVKIAFVRGGMLLGTAITASSGSSAMPAVLSATLAAAAGVYSPTKITLNGARVRTIKNLQFGYLLIAPQNRIEITEGEATTNTGAGVATITADAGNHASGGSVMRLSTASAGYQLVANYGASFSALAYEVAVFAAVRVNGAGTLTAPVSAQILLQQRTAIASAPAITFDANSYLPQLINLGTVSSRLVSTSLLLEISFTDNVHITSVDVDYIVSIALNNGEDARVIAMTIDPSNTMFFGVTAANTVALVIDPAPLTAPAPFIQANQSGGTSEPWTWAGDAFVVTKEAIVTACYLATGGGTNWRPFDTTGAALVSWSMDLSRQPASLTPQ